MFHVKQNFSLFNELLQNLCTEFFFLSLLQVVEDGYEFFAKRQLVTLFSAPNYCGEFDNAGAMMSVDETLMCSFQVSAAICKHCVFRSQNANCYKN